MFRELVKRRLADAALMEMRLNERKQQNEHKSEKICGQQDYTAPAPECVPKKAVLWTYRGNVYPKTGFWVHIGRQERSCTPGTQGAAMSMDYPPIDEAAG